MSLVVFRADGGRVIGSGHVMRCLSLASPFSIGGWQVAFAVGTEAVRTLPVLARSGYEVAAVVERESDAADALARQWPDGADILVVDHYGLDAAFERSCRPWAKRVVVIDDLADRQHDADVLADPSSPAEAYLRLVPPQCVLLSGPRYALVHHKFRDLRGQSLARRDGRAVERVLVSFGQMDAPNATVCALDALESVGFEGVIDVAIGSAAPNLDAVKERGGGRVRLHIDTDDMAELMAAADLAVGAGGGTAWERCCLGLPTVIVKIAENQRGIIARLLDAGAGLDAGAADAGVTERIRDRLRELLQDSARRRAASERGAELVDGRGALRILFHAIGGLPARNGVPVVLRPAEASDEAWLLELQRKPETRRFANDPEAPTAEGHRRWFAATVADPARTLLIIELGGERAGMVRLDRGADALRVSIATDPAFHRLGVGAAALGLAARAMPGHVLEAEVFPENAPSLALFSAAGYRQVSDRLFRREPS